MRQPLSAVDAAWLRAEDPTNLMMVTGVLLFDEPLRFDRFRAVVEERLLRYPRFRQRVREVVRSFPSNGQVGVVIQKLNPILNGWCTYFRVGNSNRTFHAVDWTVRSELQLWLRRKHQCPWRTAKKRWGYHFLHDRCRLYQMVGKVSHLEGLRRKPPDEDDRRAGCGKAASPVR